MEPVGGDWVQSLYDMGKRPSSLKLQMLMTRTGRRGEYWIATYKRMGCDMLEILELVVLVSVVPPNHRRQSAHIGGKTRSSYGRNDKKQKYLRPSRAGSKLHRRFIAKVPTLFAAWRRGRL